MEMNCLRNMCGVTRRDRVRNEEVRERVGVDIALADRVEERVLSWFGHVERLTKRVYESDNDLSTLALLRISSLRRT